MSLRALSEIRKTFGFRMMLWYSGIFALSSLAVFFLAFWYMSSSLRQRDYALIHSKLGEYAALFEKSGTQGVQRALEKGDKNLFVRIADASNRTLFSQFPPDLYEEEDQTLEFDPRDLEKDTRNESWTVLHAKDDQEDLLEIASVGLPDNGLLQVGTTNENRQDILDQFLNLFIVTVIVLVLIGFLAGALLAYRLMHPVREVIGAARSIIDTGNIEARVAATNAPGEIQELTVLFNSMLDKIETLIQGMKDSLDNVAHDLRTPVSRLRFAAEDALHPDRDETARKTALSDCLEEADRLMSMLSTLMDISEAETGAMKLDLKQWNVSSLLKEIVELYSYVAEEKRIGLSTAFPLELSGAVDRNRFQQAVANLLDNAIKYSSPGTRVHLEAFGEKDKIIVRVQDHGIGIGSEDLEKVWDRLYRGDKSRSQRGLGLGLSFVKAIVEAHHGSVNVASNPNKGSVFTISFPTD